MSLRIERLSLKIAERYLVRELNLQIAAGDIVCLMGASASGKSSILAWIAGLLEDDFQVQGQLWLNGIKINKVPTHQRGIGLLFQDHLLFPHLHVLDNLLFALPRSRSPQLAWQALEAAGLAASAQQMPHSLSGGQRARVALLRSLLAEPKALLLDEPFSKLDAQLRAEFRDYVFTSVRQRGVSTLLVSHDINDAPSNSQVLNMADLLGG